MTCNSIPEKSFRKTLGEVKLLDLDALRKAQDELRESQDRFRTLSDNIAQLAWMADKNGKVVWYNQRWFDFTGTVPEQMQGEGWEKVIHPEHLDEVKSKYQGCIERGEPWEDTFLMRGKHGVYRWFLSRAMPCRDGLGQIVRWLGTNTDITEQRQVEELLREADRRKDEYLAMLGHELRNPLAGITTATEMAKLAQPDDPRLRHSISVLERQSKHVARIVDGLLEVSRIARGKIELRRGPVEISEVMNNVLQDRISHIEKRCLFLKVNYPEKPLLVLGDWVRLVQVFDNLMGNAIKFTQSSGTITITLEEIDGFARVTIADTGVGIRPEMLSRIFEPFLQEEQDVSRTAGGLGLGLSLAKNLVELHEGTIEARSAGAGKGAELIVRLPMTSIQGEDQTEESRKQRHGKRILIVEDNADAADMLSTLLAMKGHSVSVARSGGEALEMLQARDADVVLCDIGLPGMTGYEFARTVRKRKDMRRPVLVAVTGYGQEEDRKRSKQAGFDQHLTKPLGMEALDDLLDEVA